ncbi:MAG: sodium:proton antiporter NhaD [Raineya sp.]|nr:sodium:proton antiporter NhaD [Raineya sp.]MDW8295987.1 sodium:proton antiporter NhaD [Raineya sp.]
MITTIIIIFLIGYLLIALEHNIRLNKTAPALLAGIICWAIYIIASDDKALVQEQLYHHLAEISQILFFLLGAMTIVELIDAHDGFDIVKNQINTKNNKRLLWVMSLISFFLAAIIDNLTTAIVMVSILRKVVKDKEQRLLFAGVMVICANAGGVWSPIGAVTTTMLWIKGQVSAGAVVTEVFLPSLACALTPLLYYQFKLPKQEIQQFSERNEEANPDGKTMLALGVGVLIMVPIFKTLTGLPPFMGMLFGLGLVWVISEIIHSNKDDERRRPLSVAHALSRIDTSSILFFLGILLAVGALESTHILSNFSEIVTNAVKNYNIISLIIGASSSVVDNVPLLAAVQNMYSMEQFPMDSKFWLLTAYTTGTGGSILIIGSAAGVAAMGMEDITFTWYLKRMSLIAIAGFLVGAGVFFLMHGW